MYCIDLPAPRACDVLERSTPSNPIPDDRTARYTLTLEAQ